MSGDEELCFDGEVLHETDKAFLFRPADSEEKVWLPKSQCMWMSSDDYMLIPRWLAEAKDLA
jgi:hypothetical protein